MHNHEVVDEPFSETQLGSSLSGSPCFSGVEGGTVDSLARRDKGKPRASQSHGMDKGLRLPEWGGDRYLRGVRSLRTVD